MVAPPMGASQAGMEVARQFMVVFIGSVGVTVSTTDQVVWGGVIIRWTNGYSRTHRGDCEGDEQGPSLLILPIIQSRLDHVDHLVYHLLLLLRGVLLQRHAYGRGDQKKEGEVEFEHFDGYSQGAS